MAHLRQTKEQRKAYLKAKRRFALGVSKPSDLSTMMDLYKAPIRSHKNTGVTA